MKQRMTNEDLNSLTDEQKRRLQQWWKPKQGDYALSAEDRNDSNGKIVILSTVGKHPREFYGEKGVFVAFFIYENRDNGHMGNMKKLYPLLSIGQMIELANPIRMEYKTWEYDDSERDEWVIELSGGWIYHNIDLCTALFDAVKQVI